jgi:hypothetical protein
VREILLQRSTQPKNAPPAPVQDKEAKETKETESGK